MFRASFCLLAACLMAHAEVHPMTLRQAVELAAKQNPDLMLARLDEQKARLQVRVARDPFVPRVTVGSGLAYSSGFPMSIDGAAPSVFQAHAQQFLFNRPQALAIAQAREDARGAGYAAAAKRGDVAFRAAALYLDAERAGRLATLAQKQVEGEQAVLDAVRAQVNDGRALPLAAKQAELAVARMRQSTEILLDDQATAETALAVALGFGAEDRVRALAEDRPAPALPDSQEAAIRTALTSSQEVRQIESQIVSKQIEMKGARAARLPRIDLVAQYGMLAKFNNYDQYYNHFQRNNGEIGLSFQLPVFSPSVGAQTAQAEIELAHLKGELTNTRNRIASDLEAAFRDVRKNTTAVDVARLDLDVAREQLSVNLAQNQEGRLSMRQVEEARVAENDKWIAFYDAQYALEKARWNVLRLTGGLEQSIAALPGVRP